MNAAFSSRVLQVRGLARSVAGRDLWHGIDIDLWAGESLGVVGPSGTGKSLLLRTLAGLDPLEQGSILFQDSDLGVWYLPKYRSRVMYVPQRPAIQEATAEAAFRMPFGFRSHHEKTYSSSRAMHWLQTLGRGPEFLTRPGSTLSGGEAQIVTLVRALLLDPVLLLLDEPTASLDEDTASAVEKAIVLWQQESPHRACLWTSHNREQIHRVTTRTLDLRGYA